MGGRSAFYTRQSQQEHCVLGMTGVEMIGQRHLPRAIPVAEDSPSGAIPIRRWTGNPRPGSWPPPAWRAIYRPPQPKSSPDRIDENAARGLAPPRSVRPSGRHQRNAGCQLGIPSTIWKLTVVLLATKYAWLAHLTRNGHTPTPCGAARAEWNFKWRKTGPLEAVEGFPPPPRRTPWSCAAPGPAARPPPKSRSSTRTIFCVRARILMCLQCEHLKRP